MDKIKEVVRKVINEAGPSKSFNKLASLFQKEALKHQSLVDAQKKLANAFVKETDPKKKEKLRPELIAHHKKVKAQEEIKNRAEAEMMLALDREPLDDVDESVLTEITVTSMDGISLESDFYIEFLKLFGKQSSFIKLIQSAAKDFYSNGNPKSVQQALAGNIGRKMNPTDIATTIQGKTKNKRLATVIDEALTFNKNTFLQMIPKWIAQGVIWDFENNVDEMGKKLGVGDLAKKFSINRGKEKFGNYLKNKNESSSSNKKDNLKKVLKKYGYGHNPLEDGKIKESFDTKKWKRFYDMAKDKSGKTFKQFEKEFGDVLDRPHIADAIKNASDYFDFLKRIKRFEESVTEASFPKRSFTDFVKNATAEDKNQFKRFTKYMNDFYGKKGVYPDKKGRDLSHADVMSAVDYLIKKGHKWGGGDSLDREVARDYLIDKNKLDPTYNEGIDEVKIKPTKTISKEKWKKTHKDYKSIIDGVKYVLMMTDQGTSLVPVTVESVNEVMGYKLNARDKQIIDEFVMKDFDAAMKLYKNGAYYVEKVSSGWALKGSMSGTLAAWIGDTLYYGQAYGNVTQTVINYVKKTAKYYKIQPQYKELQKI